MLEVCFAKFQNEAPFLLGLDDLPFELTHDTQNDI